jgi:molybdenum cofactor cytidylyltransferase
MNEEPIGIVVLAAGASTRMGEPKQLLRFDGRTLVRRAVDTALASSCRPVVVVLGAQADRVREELIDVECHVEVNEAWEEGMGASLRSGIAALEARTDVRARAAVVTLCDLPFVTAETLDRLVETYRATGSILVAAEYAAAGAPVRGVPALFDRAVFPYLRGLRGPEGARRVVERFARDARFLSVPEAAFDIDTPEEYDALRLGRRP